MIQRLFIANRGEIALRIARTARRMGLKVLSAYSSVDGGLPHLRLCQGAVELPGDPSRVYLDIHAMIDAARYLKADAVHPGYGFLAENEEFAAAVESAGMAFVGPAPDQIVALGDKIQARQAAQRAGVPVLPGYDHTIPDAPAAQKIAANLGFPVLLKAAGGGGGRGMRVAENAAQLTEAFSRAQSEAQAAFNDPRIFMEKYIPHVRHVEIQVVGDGLGNAVSLGERECSVQRRHQKLIEESPACAVPDTVAKKMGELAARLAASVQYRGAGTMEFLVPFGTHEFYFIEMNTRLQVEHPVTELRTGFDLVEEQILIAGGLGFSERLRHIHTNPGAFQPRGHAIEARIIAEDSHAGFRPSCGKLELVMLPTGPGIRVDGWIETGLTVSPHYDSLLAKILAWGQTRVEALDRVNLALTETLIHPVHCTAGFLTEVLRDERFRKGDYDTGLVESMLKGRASILSHEAAVLVAAAHNSNAPILGEPGSQHKTRGLSSWQRAEQ